MIAFLVDCEQILHDTNFTNFDGIQRCIKGHVGRSWGTCGDSCEDFGDILECNLGSNFGGLGSKLRGLSAQVGPSWAQVGRSWAKLGPSWGQVGASWNQVGPSWAKLEPSWGYAARFEQEAGNHNAR